MYEKISRTLGLKVIQVPRLENFAVDIEKLLPQAVQSDVVFLCNPNNPTGTVTPIDDVELIANNLPSALIVVDEAYAEFSPECSVIPLVKRCRNVTVLRTFSKAYGLAGLRIGCLIGNEELVGACEIVRLPYNISTLTERLLLRALRDPLRVRSEVAEIRKEREKMKVALRKLPIVKEVTPSGGNFLFAKIRSVKMLEQTLARERILLREISRDTNGEGSIRISIGTPEENKELVRTLKQL
jgi:histidinol-phosphate aminotransferase